MTLNETAQVFEVPMACALVAVGAFAGWVVPWDARRTLRWSIRNIRLDLEADVARGYLPKRSPRVDRLAEILQAVSTEAGGWSHVVDEHPSPALAGLERIEQAVLNRHAQQVEAALMSYARRTWFSGARVRVHVVELIAMPAPRENVAAGQRPSSSVRRPVVSAEADLVIDLNQPSRLPDPQVPDHSPGSVGDSTHGRVRTLVDAARAQWASVSGSADHPHPAFGHQSRH